jgi:hypothetical protein
MIKTIKKFFHKFFGTKKLTTGTGVYVVPKDAQYVRIRMIGGGGGGSGKTDGLGGSGNMEIEQMYDK